MLNFLLKQHNNIFNKQNKNTRNYLYLIRFHQSLKIKQIIPSLSISSLIRAVYIRMLGSLKQFIQIQLPIIQSKISTQQNQEQLNNQLLINQHIIKQRNRVYSNMQEYQPSDKKHILVKFNQKSKNNNKNFSALNNPQQKNSRNLYHSQFKSRKPLFQHTSFFSKNQITKDYIAKSELKRRHNLLRAIVRTNQNQNQNEGLSDYDQSFKRLYERFKSIYAKPILQYKNFVIDQTDQKPLSHPSIQANTKPMSSINNRKRIEYQNCLNWAKKHKKSSQFYQDQLGKHYKEKKQQNMNIGHSLMSEVQKK